MRVYYMISYDIVDHELYQQYPPKAVALITEYGGEVLASDHQPTAMEGEARGVQAIVTFRSSEAALGCYNDPRYQEAKKLRTNSTTNGSMILVSAFRR